MDFGKLKERAAEIAAMPDKVERARVMRNLPKSERGHIATYIAAIRKREQLARNSEWCGRRARTRPVKP